MINGVYPHELQGYSKLVIYGIAFVKCFEGLCHLISLINFWLLKAAVIHFVHSVFQHFIPCFENIEVLLQDHFFSIDRLCNLLANSEFLLSLQLLASSTGKLLYSLLDRKFHLEERRPYQIVLVGYGMGLFYFNFE